MVNVVVPPSEHLLEVFGLDYIIFNTGCIECGH